jgi:hypothetical protein
MVNLLRKGTPQHDASWQCYLEQREAGAEFVIADHALLEAFSVLTRTPPLYRLSPETAERILKLNFEGATIAPLRAGSALEIIRHTVGRGFGGGRVYDAAIALAIYEAGARLLLTWNVRHFLSIAPPGLEIRQP